MLFYLQIIQVILFKFVPYNAKVKTPLNGEGLQTFGHNGTRVSCQELAPRGGLTLALHGSTNYYVLFCFGHVVLNISQHGQLSNIFVSKKPYP